MADTLIPDHVDARKIFGREATIHGSIPVQRLERLSQSLSNSEGSAHAELSFTTDEARRRIITGTVKATVNAVCQRCLDAVRIDLEDAVRLALVETEEQIERLPRDLDPWLSEEALISLPDIIEEQLILSMPLVSYHPEGECTGEAADINLQQLNAPQQEDSPAEGPFAMLKDLKKKDS